MLSTLGPDGWETVRKNPDRIDQVRSEVEALGLRVVAQYALMGQYDFMNVIEAPAFTLEPQTVAHADEMFEVLGDPAIYEYENEPPQSLEWLRERFAKLETRLSADGTEHWLNWVIRLPTGELAGYVQATVRPGGRAEIAYVLSSRYWGCGLARRAVEAMISERRTMLRCSSSRLRSRKR